VDPDQAVIDQAKVTAYQRWLAADRGVGTKDYDERWRWSTADPAAFWSSIRDDFGVLGAIRSPCSEDFGAASVIDRFAQIEPSALPPPASCIPTRWLSQAAAPTRRPG
jgi:hypothetical protein